MLEAQISCVHQRNGLVNIPQSWLNEFLDKFNNLSNLALKLTYFDTNGKDCQIFVGWSGGTSQLRDGIETLEFDTSFAQNLGLVEAQSVNVEAFEILTVAENITVQPNSVDDWEVLELNAGYLEQQFLNQYRIVYLGQILTVWIHNASIKLKVTSFNPNVKNCVRLNDTSEIFVSPLRRKSKSIAKSRVIKVYPKEWLDEISHEIGSIGLPESLYMNSTNIYVQNMDYTHLVTVDNQNKESTRKTSVFGSIFKLYYQTKCPLAIVDSQVCKQLGITALSQIRCSPVLENSTIPHTLVICTENTEISYNAVKNAVVKYLTANDGVVYDKMKFELDGGLEVQIKFAEKQLIEGDILNLPQIAIINESKLERMQLNHEIVKKISSNIPYIQQYAIKDLKLPGFDNLLNSTKNYLATTLAARDLFQTGNLNGFMITSPVGNGKTSLLKSIAHYASRASNICTYI